MNCFNLNYNFFKNKISIQSNILIHEVYAEVGVPSQSAAVLYLRREASIARKYNSLVISMALQFISLYGLIATKNTK